MEILLEVLNEMPRYFSSNQFCKVAREHGYPDWEIERDKHVNFLSMNCTRDIHSNRMWYKKTTHIQNSIVFNDQIKQDVNTVDEAIRILKAEGYKVMKPVTEFVEL